MHKMVATYVLHFIVAIWSAKLMASLILVTVVNDLVIFNAVFLSNFHFYMHILSHTHAHTHACTHVRTHVCTHACTYARTHTHVRMYRRNLFNIIIYMMPKSECI